MKLGGEEEVALARRQFSYDPESGEVVRKVSSGNVAAGSACRRLSGKGYRRTYFNKSDRSIHRLAWLLHYGEWPEGQIDHINGDKEDNSIGNLRLCSTSENCLNQHGPRKNNRTGFQGVHVIKKTGRYKATLRGRHLGCFSTPEEAHEAYTREKEEFLP